MGFFWWSSGWGCICQCRWHRFYPCSVSIPRAVGQLTPHTRPHFRAFELHSCWARIPRARTPPQEKPPRWKACTRQLKKARANKWRPRRTIKKRKIKKKKACLILVVWWFSHSVVSNSCDPMDCNPPGSSVHGILQAGILEWVAISFSRGSFMHPNKFLMFYFKYRKKKPLIINISKTN